VSPVAFTDTREEFQSVFSLYVPIAGAVFVLIAIALAIPLVRDRARPGREPSRRMTAPKLEWGYITLITAIVVVLVWRTFAAVNAEAPAVGGPATARASAAAVAAGRAPLTVRVVAAKWNWRFEYPGGVVQQGVVREGPVAVVPATLVVPASQPIRFELTSLDVAHAFWIPATRFKYDAYPDRTSIFDLRFDPGVTYDKARCSEFCGEYHEQMVFSVRVLAPGAFRSWLARRQAEVRA
jgi:cytochrome c oxidase subunit 2